MATAFQVAMDRKFHISCKYRILLIGLLGLCFPLALFANDPANLDAASTAAVDLSTSASSAQVVTSFTLINADTDDPIPGYETLSDGAIIDAGLLPTSHLNVRANTNSAAIGSVSFVLDDYKHVENISPFALFGDTKADYYTGRLAPGSHVLTAIPYTQNAASGVAGTSLTVSFTVIQTSPSPTPTPTPSATPQPTPTPSATPTPTPTPKPTATPITSVALSWNASTSANIAGYHVSYGTTSGIYTKQVNVGNKTSAAISGLTSGRTYYFVVSAYNSSAAESAPSNEVGFSTASASSSIASATPQAAPSGSTSVTSSSRGNNTGATTTDSTSTTSSSSPHFASLSTRVHVGIDNDVEIVGFVISGTQRKTVIVRALGPSLSRYGVRGVLGNPALEIHDSTGNLIASNNGWRDAQLSAFAVGGPYHALQPASDLEAAIAITLPAGAYTAVVHGRNNSQGVALAEIYDVSPTDGSKLSSLTTRARVGTGDNVLIGGVTVAGDTGLKVLVRVLGPSLAGYGINSSLANPRMSLYNRDGTLLNSTDNWTDNAAQANQIMASGHAPSDSREPAMLMLLPAGNYTVVVSGQNNGTGVALFEGYSLN